MQFFIPFKELVTDNVSQRLSMLSALIKHGGKCTKILLPSPECPPRLCFLQAKKGKVAIEDGYVLLPS